MSIASDTGDAKDEAGSSIAVCTSRKGSVSGSDGSSQASSASPIEPVTEGAASKYAGRPDFVDSNDTLRLMPPYDPTDPSVSPSIAYSDQPMSSADYYNRPSLRAAQQPSSVHRAVEPAVADGVASIAAQSVDEGINTKRTMIASLASPGKGWNIIQGKEDEQVEEQYTALGLHGMRSSQDSGGMASEISRTPSQSTTGTTESSTAGSLGTAASSLQSSSSNENALPEEKELPPAPIPQKRRASLAMSAKLTSPSLGPPSLYSTANTSHHDISLPQLDSASALRRYHALLELVETERGYAEDLSTLVNVFFANLGTQTFFDESEARLKAVCRNASELLELHTELAKWLSKTVEDCSLSFESEGSDIDKAYRCEEAIVRIAQRLTQSAPVFDHYQLFCSRHAEALVLIREAEKRHSGDDFAAFERLCGQILRGSGTGRGGSGAASVISRVSSRRSSAGTSTPLALPGSLAVPADDNSPPHSGATTPSGSFASVSRQTSGRLLFADYLIKPIQRLCLYPLVLNSLLKYTPSQETATRVALETAIIAMRRIADDVDKASKQREKDLMADLLLSKIDTQQGVSNVFLKSLGNPVLSGCLDVLHHHDILHPLTAPLRFQRLGVVVWEGFLLLVRVRKNQQLDCKYWLPLSQARLTPMEDAASPGTEIATWNVSGSSSSRSLVPFPMRLSFFGHHFELSASSDKERQVWHRHISMAIEESPSVLEAIPCSLSTDFNALYSTASESLFNFFSLYNGLNSSSSSSKFASSFPDSLIKLPSPSTRAAVDRNMIFSNALLSQMGVTTAMSNSGGGFGPVALAQRDVTEALIAQQLRQSAPPSIGSAVGAAMGLARMAATQVPGAVKRARRQSIILNLTEINPACDALLVEPSSNEGLSAASSPTTSAPLTQRTSTASIRTASNGPAEGLADTNGTPRWRSSVLRRGSRVWGGGSGKSPNGSVPSSPLTSMVDLGQSLMPVSTLTASPKQEEPPALVIARPLQTRSKSMSLRGVWQNAVGGRRSSSQSANADLATVAAAAAAAATSASASTSPSITTASPFDHRSSGSISPPSRMSSLSASPLVDAGGLGFIYSPSRNSDLGSVMAALGAAEDRTNSSLTLNLADSVPSSSSPPSSSFKSIAQLRRILSTSTAAGGGMLSRSKMGPPIAVTDEAMKSSSSLGRQRVLARANTEIVFPTVTERSDHSIDQKALPLSSTSSSASTTRDLDRRRKSEPDASFMTIEPTSLRSGGSAASTAPHNESRPPSFTLSARNSLRRLRRRSTLSPSPSPATISISSVGSVASMTSVSNIWGDHNRLNSVKETSVDTSESAPAGRTYHLSAGSGGGGGAGAGIETTKADGISEAQSPLSLP